ncbi:hypothetical protein KVR01_010483 [Diaporthe batatas]|uniref:uncharacterized protein n=1 Tax=Diaporthe batatas TaxID=748121 RepID=UPI001D035FCA|nr:uncharacterized protein KVR01_010483 [Diaporthe batatas]KAG8159846.1 hypothetical protein KVR01_010483 [Diaporthe batatas]
MDRNGNFDYRNFFYPGPAPLPVQVYPVGGDPRFPFNFPPAAANINMPGSGGRDITTADDAADQSPPPPPPPPPASTVAKRDSAAASATTTMTTTTTPPEKLSHIAQGLAHLLGEAIAFCEGCLRTHREVAAAAPFAGHATRNRLWRELLEARFEADGVHKDLLHTLVPRARRYTARAREAVAREAVGNGDEDEGDEHYRLALVADKLLAQCGWVAQVSGKALGSSAACESMVETMREMVVLCGKIGPEGGAQEGQGGGGAQY